MREEGQALVKKYDGEFPERWAQEIFDYLSLPEKTFPVASKSFEKNIFDREYYEILCDNFRSPHIWQWSQKDGWEIRKTVYKHSLDSPYIGADSWEGNQKKNN